MSGRAPEAAPLHPIGPRTPWRSLLAAAAAVGVIGLGIGARLASSPSPTDPARGATDAALATPPGRPGPSDADAERPPEPSMAAVPAKSLRRPRLPSGTVRADDCPASHRLDAPPAVYLVVGGAPVPGVRGSTIWDGVQTEGGARLSELDPISLASANPFELRIADDVCAAGWRIDAEAFAPSGGLDASTAVTIASHEAGGPRPGPRLNRLSVGPFDRGSWLLSAVLDFERGTETVYWRLEQIRA